MQVLILQLVERALGMALFYQKSYLQAVKTKLVVLNQSKGAFYQLKTQETMLLLQIKEVSLLLVQKVFL